MGYWIPVAQFFREKGVRAMKLYPPAIEGKIPAFAGTTIQIPFGINRAVNMAQVDYMKLRIKSAKTNQVLSVT
jgi:hypothetical protein